MPEYPPTEVTAAEQTLEDRIFFRVERQLSQRQMENRATLEFWIKAFGTGLFILAAVVALLGYRNIGDVQTRLSDEVDDAKNQLERDISRVSENLDTIANRVFDNREAMLFEEVQRLERFMQVRDLTERVRILD